MFQGTTVDQSVLSFRQVESTVEWLVYNCQSVRGNSLKNCFVLTVSVGSLRGRLQKAVVAYERSVCICELGEKGFSLDAGF